MTRLTYAEKFGVEPERVNPRLRWWYRWQLWAQAQLSHQAWEASRADDEWGEHFTQAQHDARDWALTDVIDE